MNESRQKYLQKLEKQIDEEKYGKQEKTKEEKEENASPSKGMRFNSYKKQQINDESNLPKKNNFEL